MEPLPIKLLVLLDSRSIVSCTGLMGLTSMYLTIWSGSSTSEVYFDGVAVRDCPSQKAYILRILDLNATVMVMKDSTRMGAAAT